MARFRPSDGREPLSRASEPKTRFSSRMPDSAACALGERRPRHLSSLFNREKRHFPITNMKEKRGRTDVPQAHRPGRSRTATKARFRRWPDSQRRQAIRSPVVLPTWSGTPFQGQRSPLCVFAPLRGWVEGRALRSSRFLERAGPEGPAYKGFRNRVGGWIQHRASRIGWVGASGGCQSSR